jgi:RNA polymerase sigma factor (sigma-70 family)
MQAETQIPDLLLVKDVLSGSQGAFEQLVNQYERLVSHAIFRLIHNPADREDVCQEVFMKVYRQLRSFRYQSRLSTWIARIAYNTAVNHLRKHRESTQETDDWQQADERSDPALAMNEQQLQAFVHDKMEQLTVVEKSVLTFYHLEEMSVTEISQVMDRPEGTIKSDLYRARKKLKNLMPVEKTYE